MRLKNVLIVVKDAEASASFYSALFGLRKVLDCGGNIIMTEGLVLQDESLWDKKIHGERNSCELYFEESDIEGFRDRLERMYPGIRYADRLTELPHGKKMMRFYDPDGNLIEVGTP